jgi:hypothetical protein
MKKIIAKLITGVLLITGMLFFSSCPNPDSEDEKGIDIQYKLTVSINTRDVVKDLKDLDNADIFPNGVIEDGSHVRVKFFIYDDKGELLEGNTQIVDDFSKTVEVTKSVYPGEYTLVATADMVENTGDKIDFKCWDFENTSRLEDFKITDLQYKGFEYKAMGVSKSVVTIKKAETIEIRVEPVGSLVTFYFKNLNAQTMAYLYYTWDKSSDYYRVSDAKSNIIDGGDDTEYEIEAKYTGFYDQRYFLPMPSLKLTWATFNSKEEVLKQGSTTFSIQQAVNSLITVDVQTTNVQVQTKASFSLEDIERSRKIQFTGKR